MNKRRESYKLSEDDKIGSNNFKSLHTIKPMSKLETFKLINNEGLITHKTMSEFNNVLMRSI